jgi:hypothetical protein
MAGKRRSPPRSCSDISVPAKTRRAAIKELCLIPAKYVGDIKVAGRRSLKSPARWIQLLIDRFGKAKLRSITHKAFKTKTSRGRSVPISERFMAELEKLRGKFPSQSPGPDDRVLGIEDIFKKAWGTACEKAKAQGDWFSCC